MAVSSNEGDKGLGPGTDFTFGDMAYVLALQYHAYTLRVKYKLKHHTVFGY